MKSAESSKTFIILCLVLCFGLILGPASLAGAQAKPELTNDDCIKCHAGPPADIAAAGKNHQTEVSCQDCHAGHRPTSKDNIPECGECHEGEPHFELKGCLGCHNNPHAPLNIVLGKNITDPCLSCHDEQIKQLKENKSKHTTLFCSSCHDIHRKIPDCVQCHKPHSEKMVQADCKKCHQAHQPMVLAYGQAVPNDDCGACHKTALTILSASPAKHKTVTCVKCHESVHKNVPDCQKCHPTPHPAGIFVKFPKCGDCHYIAHDLNNWPPAKPKPTTAPAKKK